MAAICCDICFAPCKAVGYCCMGLEKACSATGALCGRGCRQCCPKDSPSPMFLNYTVIANVPIVILGIVAAILSFVEDVTARKTCGQVSGMHPGAWLLVQAAAAAFFIVFAVRIFVILSGKSHRDLESGRTVPVSHSEFSERVTRIACTEFTTFIYFLALPFSIVWSFIGLAQHDIEGCGMASWTIRLVAVLALLYVVLHLFVALASCCWSLTREQRHTLTDTPSASAQQPLHQPGSNPQAGPGKLLQHMFAPGFENYGQPASVPHGEAPPTAHMVQPPPGKPSSYPESAPPAANHEVYASAPPGAEQAPDTRAHSAVPNVSGQTNASVFDSMSAAFQRK